VAGGEGDGEPLRRGEPVALAEREGLADGEGHELLLRVRGGVAEAKGEPVPLPLR
jgi:hypothetical protein